MSFFVYIIANATDSDLYKGFTENPALRLQQHNNGKAQFTSTKTSWHFVFLKAFNSKKDALVYEKKIKKLNRKSLDRLINSEENQTSTILVN
jgi:putative endonuclease